MKSPSERLEPYPIPEIPPYLETDQVNQVFAAGFLLGFLVASIFWAIIMYTGR